MPSKIRFGFLQQYLALVKLYQHLRAILHSLFQRDDQLTGHSQFLRQSQAVPLRFQIAGSSDYQQAGTAIQQGAQDVRLLGRIADGQINEPLMHRGDAVVHIAKVEEPDGGTT